MNLPVRYNDPSPLVCVEFLPGAEQRFIAELTVPQQWSAGHQFGKHAFKLRREFGRDWKHFIGDTGFFEIDLKCKKVILAYVFVGFDTESRKPKFQIGDVEVRTVMPLASPLTQIRSRSKLSSRVYRSLKTLRAWLILLSAIVGIAAILVNKGQVLGLEIQQILGFASVGIGVVTSLAMNNASATDIE